MLAESSFCCLRRCQALGNLLCDNGRFAGNVVQRSANIVDYADKIEIRRVSGAQAIHAGEALFIQGKRLADFQLFAQMSIPDHEDVVEVDKAAVEALLGEGRVLETDNN